MSRFGGRNSPRERTEAERRQAMIERERRRLRNPNWQPPAGHPLAAPLRSGEAAPMPGTPAPDALDQLPPRERAPRRAPEQPAAPQQQPPARQQSRQPAARQPQQPPVPPADEFGGWGIDDPEPGARGAAAWPPPLEDLGAAPEQPATAAARRAAQQPPAARQERPPATPQPPAEPQFVDDPMHGEPLQIEPDPPAQDLAAAFELPDHRSVAVHRRRAITGRSGARTVVSPPGDADMGGSLSLGPSRKRRIVCGIAIVIGLAFAWFNWQLWQPLKGSGTEEVAVVIPEGSGAQEVGQALADAGVIDSPRMFSLRTLFAGMRNDLPAGTVNLKRDMSYGSVLASLSGSVRAEPELQSVVIQEGLSIRENAARLKRAGTVDDYGATAKEVFGEQRATLRSTYKVPKTVDTLEGFLFPATYELPVNTNARQLIERQLDAFEQNFAGISMTRARRANLTPYDVLIIASMIEREARLTRERELISAVIYNRLKAGMPIGIDATFRYASGDWTNPIRQSELDKDGPYNSRKRTGLPPTPIGNPGLASIEAAAKPKNVDYLYFVVKPNRCGEHAFSSTQEKFLEDQAKYNAARNAAGGSPVTC